MTEEKQAELYTSPGGKFIRADTLTRILAHWGSFRSVQKRKHYIKYDNELYAGNDVDKLQMMGRQTVHYQQGLVGTLPHSRIPE